jgi:DNA-directed RNA polymerase specialized sigma24 family protein
MCDRGADWLRRVIEELENPGVRAKLMLFARWRLDSDTHAEDLVQEALARVFDPDGSPWDPAERGFVAT